MWISLFPVVAFTLGAVTGSAGSSVRRGAWATLLSWQLHGAGGESRRVPAGYSLNPTPWHQDPTDLGFVIHLVLLLWLSQTCFNNAALTYANRILQATGLLISKCQVFSQPLSELL